MIELIDTNVIVRYLVGDNRERYEQAKMIFSEAERGKRKILVKTVVVAEVCFVLKSVYKKTEEEIALAMEVFLAQKWLRVEERQVMLLMWKWYKENLHFVDSYLLACASLEKTKIITFDHKLGKKYQEYLE
jgi:predicted nucleic acid-binding protein